MFSFIRRNLVAIILLLYYPKLCTILDTFLNVIYDSILKLLLINYLFNFVTSGNCSWLVIISDRNKL